MGNKNINQPLYNPSFGVVLDQESAILQYSEKKAAAQRKSDNSVTPIYSPNTSVILEQKSLKPPSLTKNPPKNLNSLIEKLTKTNEFYKDPDFPSETPSISDNISLFLPSIQSNDILWQRPSNLFPNTDFFLFKDDIIPNDIYQGSLGDCYFLSALAALAEQPSLIHRLFENKSINTIGCYSIWLCIDGEWENIIIDDCFPAVKNTNDSNYSLLFSRSNGPELWVLLLEKAYAKIHGSYQKIENGVCSEALRDLTGAPTEKINDFNENDAWEFMKKACDKGYLIVVASELEKDNAKGIVSGHCYSVLDVKEVKSEGNFDNKAKESLYTKGNLKNKTKENSESKSNENSDGTKSKENLNNNKSNENSDNYKSNENSIERIIKLRNPWGHKEWIGDWSDDSNKWTEELRTELNWEKKDDGVFWMGIKDFCGYYSEINVCQINQNFNYSSVKISLNVKENGNNYKIFTFQFAQQGNNLFYFTLSQSDKRKMEKNYTYSYTRMILCRYENNEVYLIEENTGKLRDLMITAENLTNGIYVIFCELDKIKNKKTLVLSSYSNLSIEFQEIKVEKHDFLDSLFNNYAKSNIVKEKIVHQYDENPQIKRITGRIADYLFICYINECEGYALQEEIEFIENTNIFQIDNKPIEKKYDVYVKPLGKYSLKFKTILHSNEDFTTFKFHSSYKFICLYEFEKIADETMKNPFKTLQRKMNGEPIDVFVYVIYKAGILGFLFCNKSVKVYKEATHFTTKNLKAKNFDPDALKVQLQPDGKFFIVFEIIDQNLEVSYKMSYVPIFY